MTTNARQTDGSRLRPKPYRLSSAREASGYLHQLTPPPNIFAQSACYARGIESALDRPLLPYEGSSLSGWGVPPSDRFKIELKPARGF
jgi:hypothetical protein